MTKRRWQFRLRTLFLLITIVALGLSAWTWHRQVQILAQEHHYASLAAGYTAASIQKPNDKQWIVGWRTLWEWPSSLQMERGAMEQAFPYWEESVRHAKLRDHYLKVRERPWMMLCPAADTVQLAPPPNNDQQLSDWWDAQISPHIAASNLNRAWGSYPPDSSVADREIAILNIAPASFNRFLHLRDIMPVEDGWNDDAELTGEREPE